MPFFRREADNLILALAYQESTQLTKLYYNTNDPSEEWTLLPTDDVTVGTEIFSHLNYQREEDDIIMFADGSWLKF